MPAAFKRFIILSGPRTGSTLVQSALNSSAEITCFGEIFNQQLDDIDYRTEGYETTEADVNLRAADPGEFLRTRIFIEQARPVRATGFKFHYDHLWGFPGLVNVLKEDRALSVVHLRRLNVLRTMVSAKIAEETGVYVQSAGTRSGLVAKAARLFRRVRPRPQVRRSKIVVRPEDFRQAVIESDLTARHWAEIFEGHKILKLNYEDLVPDPRPEFDRIQSFLGVAPVTLGIMTARQNAGPIEELISNYDELRDAFQDTEYETYLD
jgi:LPS sulfotransferase NodH